MTNISHELYLQDGGKNQLTYRPYMEQNYVTVTLCIRRLNVPLPHFWGSVREAEVREWGEGKCPSDPQISDAYSYLASACPHAVLSRARSFMHRSLGGATRVMRHRTVNYKLHAVVIRVASVTWHNADPQR